MAAMKTTPNVDQVVGGNVRRLRGGQRQDELAVQLRQLGCEWTQATVAAVETGRRRVRISELPPLCSALDCSISELLAGDGQVELPSGQLASLPTMRGVVTGETKFRSAARAPRYRRHDAAHERLERHARLAPTIDARSMATQIRPAAGGEAERNAARKLGTDPLTVTVAAFGLWGRSLTAERDAQVTDQASADASARSLQAIRGRVTRRLVEQLQERIEEAERGER